MEMRLRQANPVNLDAFFTALRGIWLESRGRNIEQIGSIGSAPPSSQALAIQPQRREAEEDWLQLAKDLDYTGVSKDHTVLKAFIYEDLGRRLGRKTAHVRKSPFAELEVRNTNATKKAVRKVIQKAPVKRIVRLCSVCRKAGHTKINCPGVKRTKKVNFVYHDEVEKSEDPEEEYIEEYILEEEEDSEEEEVEEDIEYVDDDDSTLNTSDQNCYAIKKKWYEVQYL